MGDLGALWILPIAWVVTAAGRRLTRWLPPDVTPLERTLIGSAVGLGLLAYGILALGLLGLLALPWAAGWLLLLAVAGGRQHAVMASELRARACLPRWTGWGWGAAALFAAFAIVALVGDFAPPTLFLPGVNYTEWDSLAYHLADPKLYIQAHRIYYLPWESHSNFAFTAEMWYTVGLLFHSVPLAKLFHFACAVGACLATYALGARHLTPRVGLWAALLLASTPLVFWEAGTAYVDLATMFFATVTLLAVANGMAARDERWLWAGAVLLGLTLSTKATALTTLALLAAGLLVWRIRVLRQGAGAALGRVAAWCALALLVGCPWLVKSAAYTGNPVYPFYYQLFGGRYWNHANAVAYDQSNAAFGMGRSLDALLLAPWNLTMYLLPGHPTSWPLPFNNFPSPLATLTPVLVASLFFFPFAGGTPRAVQALTAFSLASLLVWFATMQYARYLLPAVPVFCLLAAWALTRALAARWLSGYALAGLAACSLAFSLFVGAWLVSLQAPVALGQMPAAVYISRGYAAYGAMRFVSAQPGPVKVVFYGAPFGFYCDKPYLWGDPNHSTYIPYDSFHSADDLLRSLRGLGVTHILVNRQSFPLAPGTGASGWVYALTDGSGRPPMFDQRKVAVYALPERLQKSQD